MFTTYSKRQTSYKHGQDHSHWAKRRKHFADVVRGEKYIVLGPPQLNCRLSLESGAVQRSVSMLVIIIPYRPLIRNRQTKSS
jgi:hypothetical protein